MTHRQRRFVLDRLGLGVLFYRLSRRWLRPVALPGGKAILINPLLHSSMVEGDAVVYEPEVLDTLRRTLTEGGVFYDIGANVGVFSFIAAGLVGSRGEVHAFEPERNNVVCFRRTLSQPGWDGVHLHEVAVGAEDGTMAFDRRGGAFSGRLVAEGANAHGLATAVPVRAIDSLVNEGAPPPTMVKIDVEGGEGEVLAGMRGVLERDGPAVLCELHAFNPAGVAKAVSTLRDAAYLFHDMNGRRLPGDLDPARMPGHVLALPDRSDDAADM